MLHISSTRAVAGQRKFTLAFSGSEVTLHKKSARVTRPRHPNQNYNGHTTILLKVTIVGFR